MTEDYYATLGVEPRSEAAVIRAAYLALMHRYHPDKNDSPAAVERAHAIIAAFAVLGDVERRLHYDWGRRRAAEAAEAARRSWRGRGPRVAVAVGAGLLLLVAVMAMPPGPVATPPAVRAVPAVADAKGSAREDREGPATVPAAMSAEPAGPAPALTDSEPRTNDATPDARLPAPAPRAVPVPDRLPTRSVTRRPAAPAPAKAKCRLVRPGAEAAICNDDNLIALDGHVVTFYNQSLLFGTAAKRSALIDARSRFLARREGCHTADCLRTLHLAHLREMAAIIENRPASRVP